MIRLIIAAFLMLEVLPAQQAIQFFSVADIVGTGSVVAIGTGNARFCQLTTDPNNGSSVRWGDSAITTSRGATIGAGFAQFIPPGQSTAAPGTAYVFSLAKTYVLAQTGDKVSITCAR